MDTPDVGIPPRLAARLSMAEQYEYLRGAASRRAAAIRREALGRGSRRSGVPGPGRRRVLASGAALAGGALLAGCSGPGASTTPSAAPATVSAPPSLLAPFGRHLALGADPRTQMRIGWQVPAPVRKPFVRLARTPGDPGERIAAELRPLRTPALGDRVPALEQYYLHAALDGLEPGSTYHYGLGHEGRDPGPQAGAVFRTAPARPERFTFTAFGDQGISRAGAAMAREIAGLAPAFHLHAGDICYAEELGHGDEGLYDARVWDTFMRQNDPVAAAGIPWMIATGNHDMEALYSPDGYGGQLARWSLPGNGFAPDRAPGAYSFVYGNTGFVALDANDVSYEIPANLGYSGGAQTRWLDRTLARLRAKADFVVVFFHHCAYSTSRHSSDGGIRTAWVPLFDRHRVDLVINGHNHVYERTDPLRRDTLTRPLPVGGSVSAARHGTVYVTAGGGGREVTGFKAPDSYAGRVREADGPQGYVWHESGAKGTEDAAWSRVRYTGHSFLVVEALPGPAPRLNVSARTERGGRIDAFELEGV